MKLVLAVTAVLLVASVADARPRRNRNRNRNRSHSVFSVDTYGGMQMGTYGPSGGMLIDERGHMTMWAGEMVPAVSTPRYYGYGYQQQGGWSWSPQYGYRNNSPWQQPAWSPPNFRSW